ncbi:MAG TPA: hypothetical protein VH498_08795 [Candidatus Dormibacteraeota bacterium]|jgi:hypothetical protein|nr:hypothetical protein [Candidatus Dormibacteraeota bacterium]
MEPSLSASTVESPSEIVAHIDQKAVRLSALLRDIDNHPIALNSDLRERLDEILEMLACRVTATRALLHQAGAPELSGAGSAA